MLNKSYILLFFISVFLMTSCLEEDMNVSPNEPAQSKAEWLLTAAQKSMSDEMWDEWNNGRMGMYYAQYFSATSYTEESRYQIRENVNNTFWNRLYSRALADLNVASTFTENPNKLAILDLNKAYIYHVLTDVYGPIPFKDAGKGLDDPNPAFDSQQDVYNGILALIDGALATFDDKQDSFEEGDIIYKGNIEKWTKFANSLKLRVAIRMSDVEPALAKTVGEAAIAAGVMEDNSHSALFKYQSGAPNNNPLQQNWVGEKRQDFSPSATLINYMSSVNDPRLSAYARPAKNSAAYTGMAYGLNNDHATEISNDAISLPSELVIETPESPAVHLSYSEVEFMLAEAKERGWTVTGTAEEHYKAGITASLAYWGVSESANTYLTAVPYTAGNWKNVIGTQKWLAMYMQGIQGWLERIRLDFKQPDGSNLFVFPADGSLDDDITEAIMVPQRMTYPSDEKGVNETNLKAAVGLIGGEDKKSIKLWWNKN